MYATSFTVQVGSIGTTVGTLDNYVIRKVLTPAPTGVWMTQANGTPGYVSMDSEFNLNSATYTVTIAGSQINSGVHAWAPEFAGKFDGSGYTAKGYDLAPINPVDVLMATGAKQPQKVANQRNGKSAWMFTGANSTGLQATYLSPLVQPFTTIIAGQDTADSTNEARLIDSSVSGQNGSIYYVATTKKLTEYAGTALNDTFATKNTPLIISGVFNGASSALRQNGSQVAVGNAGTGSMSGITIGNFYGLSTASNDFTGPIWGVMVISGDQASKVPTIENFWNTALGVY
jgi:hypothetical protein